MHQRRAVRVGTLLAGLTTAAFSTHCSAHGQATEPAPPLPPPGSLPPNSSLQPDGGRLVLDILAPPPEEASEDPLAAQECARERDVARIAGQIIVCRTLQGVDSSGFDKADWERRYANRTQGPKPSDVEGAGGSILMPGEGSLITITLKARVGDPPDPALMIDVESLPQAPPGSDADRIAQGLPPQDGD